MAVRAGQWAQRGCGVQQAIGLRAPPGVAPKGGRGFVDGAALDKPQRKDWHKYFSSAYAAFLDKLPPQPPAGF
jgi:hypothetical protein